MLVEANEAAANVFASKLQWILVYIFGIPFSLTFLFLNVGHGFDVLGRVHHLLKFGLSYIFKSDL